ncbi:hypothetical protein HPB47_007992 [Ixodes persulcatus]|uniref:Uncharacterized protein n=1 Tax=Ixodes persulcatus TaxID=34615 RepID=A0AC60P603_IXOPE|nr:hypothetical protein HPB47_007992 [Ixodes persulcatus]
MNCVAARSAAANRSPAGSCARSRVHNNKRTTAHEARRFRPLSGACVASGNQGDKGTSIALSPVQRRQRSDVRSLSPGVSLEREEPTLELDCAGRTNKPSRSRGNFGGPTPETPSSGRPREARDGPSPAAPRLAAPLAPAGPNPETRPCDLTSPRTSTAGEDLEVDLKERRGPTSRTSPNDLLYNAGCQLSSSTAPG